MKSTAFKMGMSRKGFNTIRSLSTVIKQDAFDKMANSRNLLSLASLQSLIIIEGVNILEFISNLFIINQRSTFRNTTVIALFSFPVNDRPFHHHLANLQSRHQQPCKKSANGVGCFKLWIMNFDPIAIG